MRVPRRAQPPPPLRVYFSREREIRMICNSVCLSNLSLSLLHRPFTPSDMACLPSLITVEVARACRKVPWPYTDECAAYFLHHVCTLTTSLTLAIVVRRPGGSDAIAEEGCVVGCVSLDGIASRHRRRVVHTSNGPMVDTRSASIGYWLGKAHWAKG